MWYSSLHEFAYIPMAALHINTSTVQVRFSFIEAFLRGSCFDRQPVRVSLVLPIYAARSNDMTQFCAVNSYVQHYLRRGLTFAQNIFQNFH